MSISISTKKDVDRDKYYSLYVLYGAFSIKKLHKVLRAAHNSKLVSKYSKLIANNSNQFAFWYEKAYAAEVPEYRLILFALIAIKANLQPEQSILTVRDILKKKRTATNKHNMDLFYASHYHGIIFNIDAANYTYISSNIYSRWYHFL